MIPIIYSATENEYASMGIGRVNNATKGSVHEKLNGLDEFTFTVPESAEDADLLTLNNQLWVRVGDNGNCQPFRIYRIVPVAGGNMQVYARHKLYDARGITIAPFTAVGVVPALTGLISNSMETNPFSVWTDIENTETSYSQEVPLGFRQCLGGVQGSILQRFGGEYEWDVNTVKLHAHRGTDTGVYIQYKKNLTAFQVDRNNDAAYTGCLAYYKSDENVVIGDIQRVENYTDFPVQLTFNLDCSSEFETTPTVAELNARAVKYMTDNNFGVPWKDTLKISFIPLWKTEEYKNYASLERVSIGDYIHVTYKGYDIVMEVIETEYDPFNERIVSLTLGNRKASLESKIAQIATDAQGGAVDEAVSMMEQALQHAADVISGGTGGYVYISRNADGEPNEIYIMDSPDINTAVNLLRMNYAGIAFSQTGINGQFTTAWTIDSHFVADFITVGTLEGNLIRAGSVLTSALEVAVQTLVDNLKLNFSFLNDGLHIATKDGNTIVGAYQTILSDLGMRVIQTSTSYPVIVAEQDTVTAVNLTADNYLRIRAQNVSSRFQQFYSTPHSENEFGVFWEIV